MTWVPTPEFIRTTNIAWLMTHAGVESYEALHAWSVREREAFWAAAIERLGLRFQRPYRRVLDLSGGVESPQWLPEARLNIVESCFRAPAESPAIVHQAEDGPLQVMSVSELERLTNRVAASLARRGIGPGDAVAVMMPMTAESVAICLGIIQVGAVLVGIADSFPPKEIATRLRLSKAVAFFTQDVALRGGKQLPMYAKAVEAGAPPAIVLTGRAPVTLRPGDCPWPKFLKGPESIVAVPRAPGDSLAILFSSGTTGAPKAIPWAQATPIKCAADAHFHQNIQRGDRLVWPTNVGWMMGPWLIFASLMNRAAMGLFDGAPTGRAFGQFVQDSGATMLGVVPSLVKAWRASDCMAGLDWSALKLFSSTGECSNADDMRWLMGLPGGRPVIEYCGGTEIGGGYITGAVTRPCVAGTFNTPALGLDFVILDEAGQPANNGELFLVPPSIGLSTTLLNADHHAVYFAGTPRGETLRRHGDQVEALPDHYWRAHGRADDTMNLGGIKVSAAEIERTLQAVPGVTETAAIAVASGDGGPSQLVIYLVGRASKEELQNTIRRDLNPLFKIHDVSVVDSLPRTASNKVMRRVLRDRYTSLQ